jgi:hypothetical protein
VIAELFAWVSGVLATAGVPAADVTMDAADWAAHWRVPSALVLFGPESFTGARGVRVAQRDTPLGLQRRRRLFPRSVPVAVTLLGRDVAAVEVMLVAVAEAAYDGLAVGDDRVRLSPARVSWDTEKSSLKGAVAATLEMVAAGGVFRTQDVALVGDVAPEPEESVDG